jgi:hypothetical protein
VIPAPERLAALEADVDRALVSGDLGSLEVLGYGEISCVLALDGCACKRLPPFPDEERLERYRAVFERYLGELARRGVAIVPSRLVSHRRPDGRIAVYCVQPMLDPAALGPRRLAAASVDEAGALFALLLDQIQGAVGPLVGIDGQLSNWAFVDGKPSFFDVSTPFLRAEDGRELLDTDLFVAALPWLMRPVVRRFLLRDILDKYYQLRGVVLDFLGNLHKERLDRLTAPLLEIANRRVDPPISADEPARYYRGDKRLWELLLRARRLDRAWQRGVRRRPYPFLLPGKIER